MRSFDNQEVAALVAVQVASDLRCDNLQNITEDFALLQASTKYAGAYIRATDPSVQPSMQVFTTMVDEFSIRVKQGDVPTAYCNSKRSIFKLSISEILNVVATRR